MDVKKVCKSYFNGFKDLSTFKTNTAKKNVLGVLKTFSYFTVAAPLAVGLVYGAAKLHGRITQKTPDPDSSRKMSDAATSAKVLPEKAPPVNPPAKSVKEKPIQIPEALVFQSYPGDLNEDDGVTYEKIGDTHRPNLALHLLKILKTSKLR